jgi:hypothetical protein
MINTLHYPSLQLCKKLAKIGFKTNPDKDFYPNSELAWFWTTRNGWSSILKDCWEMEWSVRYPCPSIMEMLDIIPEYINSDSHLTIGKHYCSYENTTMMQENSYIWSTFIISHSHYLPNSIAEMIIWLYEHKYISFTK